MPSVRAIPKPRLKPGHPSRKRYAVPAKILHRGRYLIPALLFLATMLVTTIIGARYMYDFHNGQLPLTSSIDLLPYKWDWSHLHMLASGLPFSLTILSILGAYELGRYLACRHFGVAPAIPLFLPVPTLTGTLGVFDHTGSQAGSRIRSRSALIAISAAGPVAGFAVAVATTCYGLVRSTAIGSQTSQPLMHLAAPELISVLRSTLLASFPDIPPILQMLPHPVLVASWIGLLITAIKLIPAGQSDGGHIVYAVSPRLHRTTSTIVIAVLIYMGTVEWIGWLLGAALLIVPSIRHPRLPEPSPPGIEWLILAPVCLTIFLLTVSTQPITGMNLVQVLLRIHWGLAVR